VSRFIINALSRREVLINRNFNILIICKLTVRSNGKSTKFLGFQVELVRCMDKEFIVVVTKLEFYRFSDTRLGNRTFTKRGFVLQILINIKYFKNDPSINTTLNFLRLTPWA